jgi:hypothetical protein
MTTEFWTFFGIIMAALLGNTAGLYALYQGRKKVRIEEENLKEQRKKMMIEERNLEDQITERVLNRAREQIDILYCENEKLRCKIEKLEKSSEENEALRTRVKELETAHKALQAEYEELKKKFNQLCGIVQDQDGYIEDLVDQLEQNNLEPVRNYERRKFGEIKIRVPENV